MAERNARPANSTKVPWPAATYGTTDPASQRAAGWAPNEVPDNDEFNFLQKMWGEELVWLLGYLAREWADIEEAGPTDMAVGELLAVVPPAAGANARGSAVFSGVTSGATGGGNIYHLCTDGEYGYYVSGGGGAAQTRIVKFDMSDGSLTEQVETYAGNAISALAVDGAAVFTMGANAADPGLERWARADLDGPQVSAGTEYACTRLVCNGYYAAGIAPNSGAGKVVVYSDINGTLAEDGTYDTASNMAAVAIDAENVYIGGTRSTYDVWAVVLSTRAHTWRTTLPTSSAPTISGIAVDGDRVYVCSDRVALTAGGNANLHCLDRMSGAVLWSADIGSTSDLVGLSLDDKYLYTSDGTTTFQVDKGNPPAVVQHMAAVGSVYENVADGVSLLAVDSPISSFSRYWTQPRGRKLFVRAVGTDRWRAPFHHIVVPG